MTKPDALRLANWLDAEACGGSNWNAKMNAAAAEIRRLHSDAAEAEFRREWISSLLTSTAIALRGPEPELTNWSWHDLPERAAALVAQRDALLEALKELVAFTGAHGGPYVQARAAIKKAEEA